MKKFFSLIVYFFFLYGCVPVRVTTERINEIVPERYSTYNFYSIDYTHYDHLPYDQENFEFLLTEIKHKMQERGFALSEDPDLFINIGIVIEEQVQSLESDPRLNTDYVGQREYYFERDEHLVSIYDEGAITIDIVDAHTNRLFWQGTAVGMLASNEKKLKKRLTYAVDKIFNKIELTAHK